MDPHTRGMDLQIVNGDITRQRVDAIVNAANARMRGGGGVDGAIHRVGGGDLPATWVIHVVGPNYRAGQRDRSLLTACYRNALRVADDLGATSVAFPLVSAGIYGWPLDDAAGAAVDTLRATLTSVERCLLVAFGEATFDAVRRALG